MLPTPVSQARKGGQPGAAQVQPRQFRRKRQPGRILLGDLAAVQCQQGWIRSRQRQATAIKKRTEVQPNVGAETGQPLVGAGKFIG